MLVKAYSEKVICILGLEDDLEESQHRKYEGNNIHNDERGTGEHRASENNIQFRGTWQICFLFNFREPKIGSWTASSNPANNLGKK